MKHQRTIRELLDDRAQQTPDFLFGIYENWEISFFTLHGCVNRVANGLAEAGVTPGQRVAVMLGNHPDHIFTIFALAQLGAVWIPVNVNLRGPSLAFVFEKSSPSTLVADAEFEDRLRPVLTRGHLDTVIFRGPRKSMPLPDRIRVLDFSAVSETTTAPLLTIPTLDEIRCISFTSGTTGEPKGALVTERMLMNFAAGAGIAADARAGDVFLLWEPLYHNSGVQMCILALIQPVRLAIVPKFSAYRFWEQIRKYRVTKIHYLGGMIDILLKLPGHPKDKDHSVELAFGGGCSESNWRAFETRFGVRIQEAYGMTEASGFTTLNTSGKLGSIGKPYPYLEVWIVDEEGRPLGPGEIGEIVVRGKEPGLITEGYLENPEATRQALRDGWLYTGDLGSYDEEGDFYFKGRKKDSIRRRGENISAWEVERVLNSNPKIEESAVIGVDADVGEQELKVFVKPAGGAVLEPLEIIQWCESLLPYYQIPRYLSFVNAFEKTPTERIRKEILSKDTAQCWDLERSGYRIKRG